MLKSLNIENIAIIEKCNIDFSLGFNCLTGETGAGKSIIIDSLNAVMGQRTSKELIRTGCNKAVVSALFYDVSQSAENVLSKYGVSPDEERSVLISRIITVDGKNICKVNGISVNVSTLREIGTCLLNIHGQHDNQALLDPDNHCSFIDSYGDYEPVLLDYVECYNKLKQVRRKLKNLKAEFNDKEHRLELLKFQVNEIEAANIKVGELDTLIKRRDEMRNFEKISNLLNEIYSRLCGDDEQNGADFLTVSAAHLMLNAAAISEDLKPVSERLTAVSAELTDLCEDVRNAVLDLNFDPAELDSLEQRIDLLKSLNKKYGGDEAAVLQYYGNAVSELGSIENSDKEISQLEEQSDDLDEEIYQKGRRLTDARKRTALEFSEKICKVLKFLEMPNVSFSVRFEEGMYTVNGCDEVEFLISANLGQEERSLSKIASGGELSRTMLAIKSVLNDENGAQTLIFDEIDAGISGRAADKVGRQLRSLSCQKQVICVTHLAQIAAAADCHLLISKSESSCGTRTEVEPIDGDKRIFEIARIMSGGEMTENLYKTAKELIENHHGL